MTFHVQSVERITALQRWCRSRGLGRGLGRGRSRGLGRGLGRGRARRRVRFSLKRTEEDLLVIRRVHLQYRVYWSVALDHFSSFPGAIHDSTMMNATSAITLIDFEIRTLVARAR